MLIAALADRLIYDSDTTFAADDARQLLGLLPRTRPPLFELGVRGKMSGGSTRGYAAGVGDVKMEDKDKSIDYSTGQDHYTRAGQWKLVWYGKRAGQFIDIEQVMTDVMDDGRAARLGFDLAGEPIGMDIRFSREFRLFWSPIVIAFPGWRHWKQPA